jgi:hypothetical protein
MARVKVSKVPVDVRVSDVARVLRESHKNAYSLEAYAYTCGYLESAFSRALALLPPKKREEFLSTLEHVVIDRH